MADYYNVTTNIGDAEIAAAIASNTKLDITHIAFGDGNGAVPTPSKTRTTLVREVHRQAVNKYERHPTNANWLVIETIIPSNIGDFTIREIGVIANGKLISHGSHAPFEKVTDPTGVSEYRLKFTQNITDGSVVEITLDESLIFASQAWVEENFIKCSEIVDNLTTDDATKPISAKQAKNLQDNKLGKDATAATAEKLATKRTIGFSGAATGSFQYDGSGDGSCILTLANSGVVASTYGSNLKIPVLTINAKGLITGVSEQTIPSASETQAGIVKLNNTLISSSTTEAVTAAQAKELNDKILGVNQTPKIMTGSRALDTNYINTTGRTVFVTLYCTSSGNTAPEARITVSEILVAKMISRYEFSEKVAFVCYPVPPGAQYKFNCLSHTSYVVTELN